MQSYVINEVFKTIQGEGVRAGTVNVFVRFSGCNMTCRMEAGDKSPGGFDCDTEFASGRKLSLDELMQWIKDEAGECRWIVATGGEPGLQLDKPFVNTLHDAGFKIAVETNGSIDLSELRLDWVCVSPKVAEHAVRQMTADEIKYVRHHGQGIPKPSCLAYHRLISPAFSGATASQRDLEWCKALVLANPEWRLSVQQHKLWGIR